MADLHSLKQRKAIAENINRAISESGMPLWRIAKKTGIHYNTINNWVSCKTVPSAIGIIVLAETLNVSTDYLLKGIKHGKEQGKVKRFFEN